MGSLYYSFFFAASLKFFTVKSLESLNAVWYPRLDPCTKVEKLVKSEKSLKFS